MQTTNPELKFKTQQILISELKDPDEPPTDEIVEFAAMSLMHPVAAIATLALKRLLADPNSVKAQEFAKAAIEDLDTIAEASMRRNPLTTLSRLAGLMKEVEVPK